MSARTHHVSVLFDSWSQVIRMCTKRADREVYVRVSGPDADLGDAAQVKLVLPDSLSLLVEGEVQAILDGAEGAPPTVVIELCGFTHELAMHLESVVERARDESDRWLDDVEPLVVESMKVSELVLRNRRLSALTAASHK
jgi:hypothetical protein